MVQAVGKNNDTKADKSKRYYQECTRQLYIEEADRENKKSRPSQAYSQFLNSGNWNIFFFDAYKLREWYGFLIGAAFSGVIGVGFYPILGNRVWCRFGCPMAAVLGMQQRLFSRFRITTNGGQCISCGNCSTYCEMGIDVRSYAQKGQNIVRSSCVGCGICSAVCPRGVLKLENGPLEGRINSEAVLLGNDVDLLDLIKRNAKSH